MTEYQHQHQKPSIIRQANEVGDTGQSVSPAQRYTAFRRNQRYESSFAARFARSQPFVLDDFQIQANSSLESGNNLLVAAPTGAGKTVIANFAIFLAEQKNVKTFYTTPIKALSNQKYHDLMVTYGSDKVGLLTGDVSINSEANIVVMTTEVLRNMLYEHSSTLNSLGYVILDEVHYLADRLRGPVWEEVIIDLPKTVRIVALSATVSNVEDFSAWIESVRGNTSLVVSEKRPVALDQMVLLQSNEESEPELFDLYQKDSKGKMTHRLNTSLTQRLEQLECQASRGMSVSAKKRRGSRRNRPNSTIPPNAVQRHIPSRWAVVDELHFLDMLPGIYFVFSRQGCIEAVEQCVDAGLQLTNEQERIKIRAIVDEMSRGKLSQDDLNILRFSEFRFALEQGFAAHHAGMVIFFRQIVERLFTAGLVKMVFATETLSLGINMPARSVIVDKLEKYDGVDHVLLTAGEFTQLTGRAGRRGIDTIGHAIVVDHRKLHPQILLALSSKRVYPLHSSFRPTFNMSVNLLNSLDYKKSCTVLDLTFAQWEANESSKHLEQRMQELTRALEGYEQAFQCQRGDFKEFMNIRMKLSDLEKNERERLKHQTFVTQKERREAFAKLDQDIAHLHTLEKQHPSLRCPDFREHLKWGHRWARETRELWRLEERYHSRTGSMARQFGEICKILESLGYLENNCTNDSSSKVDYLLTSRGELLRHFYMEHDLTLSQAIQSHILDELNPSQLAAVISGLVYHARFNNGGEPRYYPGGANGRVAQAGSQLRMEALRITKMCERSGLELISKPDFGICDVIYEWAQGENLSTVMEECKLTGGDFVRNVKRIIDILQQIATAHLDHTHTSLPAKASEAIDRLNRDIVVFSGLE